jgi:RNA polymerase sigma-70 factor, ECF subfamily
MSNVARADEELLIARSQNGDVQAFNQLVLLYQQTLYGAVFRLVGNYDVASDVTQDAFLSAFRAIKSYRGGSSFKAWLLRIGTNLACDYWRRTQRQRSESLESLTDEEELHSPELLAALASSDLDANPETHILTQELQACIQLGLQQLPLDQRTAVVLCDIEGLAYEEVAAIMQVPLGTVRSRISRGRTRLRNFLLQYRELLPRTYRHSSNDE